MKGHSKTIFKNVGMTIQKRSPEILIGVGIVGMVTSTVLAVKATPKAIMLLEERKKRQLVYRNEKMGESLTPLQTIETTWKCYIPSATVAIASIICFVSAASINKKRNAALMTAYTLSESTLREYQQKVIETIGKKKEEKIRDEIAKDKIEKTPIANREVVFTGKGDTLCFDVISSRYFHSNIETIRKAVNELNKRMLNDTYISLNEFYYELGLLGTSIGDELGWNINRGGFIELDFSSQLAENDMPCLVVSYRVEPRYDYTKW